MIRKIYWIVFVLSLIATAPSIIKFVRGDYQASQIFSRHPFRTTVKSIVLRNYPEWKPIEEGLEQIIPQSSANVSVSTLYAEQGKQVDLEISIITDNKLSENQIETVRETVCNILKSQASKYSHIKISISDLKFNSSNTISTDVRCE